MTKLIKSLVVMVAVGAVVAGATIAYFNDIETSSGNSITSGTLNLQLECPAPVITLTDPLHPNSGTDTTGYPWYGYSGTYTLTGSDLNKLATSDDNRYTTQYAWYNLFTDPTDGSDTYQHPLEFLNFGMPNIPDGATVNSASLKIEWRRGSGVNAARVRVYDGSSWQTISLPLPAVDTDTVQTVDLYAYGFTTKAKIDALQVQFQATQSGGYEPYDNSAKTSTDLVEVNGSYTVTGTPFWCEDGLVGNFVVSNIKPTDVGAPAMIKYQNAGSVDGNLKVKLVVVSDDENGRNVPETVAGDTTDTPGELSQYLHLYVNDVDQGTFASFAGGSGLSLGTLTHGSNGSVKIGWELPSTSTDNQVQSDGVQFNIELILEQ